MAQITNRQKLAYSLGDSCLGRVYGVYVKFFSANKIPSVVRMKEKMYKQAMTKIDDELDIRHITKELRTLKFISNVLLTKYQRFMIPHFKMNVLNAQLDLEKIGKEPIDIRSSLGQTIEGKTKLDIRIIKNIDTGSTLIQNLTQNLRHYSQKKPDSY
jgi:hypothetical protein